MKRAIVSGIAIMAAIAGVWISPMKCGCTSKTIFDGVKLYKTTAGELEDSLKKKGVTVKESSSPVNDTFLGFYSQESFSSDSPENLLDENGKQVYKVDSVEDFILEYNNDDEIIQHSIPAYDSSESISDDPRNDVISQIDVSLFFKSNKETKKADTLLTKYLRGLLLADFKDPIYTVSDGGMPTSYYPISSINVYGTTYYQCISWEKDTAYVVSSVPKGYLKSDVYDLSMQYLSETDIDEIKNSYENRSADSSSANTASSASTDDSWKATYSTFLKSYTDDAIPYSVFNLDYINDDDIPELFIISGDSHGGSAAIYTYYNKKIVLLGNYGSSGKVRFARKQNMIMNFYCGMGTKTYSFSSISNGKAKTDNTLEHVFDLMAGPLKYTVNNKTTTKETYDKTLNKLLTRNTYTVKSFDHGYPLTDDYIDKLLSN